MNQLAQKEVDKDVPRRDSVVHSACGPFCLSVVKNADQREVKKCTHVCGGQPLQACFYSVPAAWCSRYVRSPPQGVGVGGGRLSMADERRSGPG